MKPALSRSLLAGGGVATAAALYFFADPSRTSWLPRCLFLRLTGLQCPGCGAQRMIHALLHGDIASAWGYNAFLLLMLPLIALMIWAETQRKRRPEFYARFHSLPLIIGVGCAIIAWFIIRNFII